MRSIAALVLWLFSLQMASAQPSPQLKRHSIKDTTSIDVGAFRRDVATGPLPFNKRYDELTLAQQDAMKSEYEHMAPGDEPPFPANGLQALYKALADANARLAVFGDLTLFVDVDAQGQAVAVEVVLSPDTHMARFAAEVALREKYKPALCDGQPCRMQFPIRVHFKRF